MNRYSHVPFTLLTATLLGACAPKASTTSTDVPAPEAAPEPAPQASEEPEQKPTESKTTILADIGLETPESVYFDRRRDVYLVSNVNGAPTEKDGNGFISRLTPQPGGDFKIELKFIDGARKGTTLNAPKGLTIVGDTLYVADIDRVKKFDALTGASRGEIILRGSTFVNDVATGEDGYVYVTDSGLTASFEPNGTDAIYRISPKDEVKKIAKGKALGSPNGVLASAGGAWVTTFGSGELYWVSNDGEITARKKLPQGQNDGIIFDNDGKVFVSSWEGSSVLSGPLEDRMSVAVSGVKSPADIGYDCTRNKLLIPLFTENKVVVEQLGAAAAQ